MKASATWHVSVWFLTLGLASTAPSSGSQKEDDSLQSVDAGENSCSLLSKTVSGFMPLSEGI